ncbi:hypothetical protein [Qaidamihabitans albus]|uniref:hypothetical protein n=1 Tax=Qaidamihabitans albus TaxID=2795733 RepID=UPI0018F15A7E|nr:hypothetical protein [Qaidamihabitans albus]
MTESTTISAELPWISATATEDGRYLTVYASPCVKESDDSYRPVREYLAGKCYSRMTGDSVKDENMMFGEARTVLHEIHEQCPDYSHTCSVETLDEWYGDAVPC